MTYPRRLWASNQATHSRRYLVLTVLQNRQEGIAQGFRPNPESNALLEEGTDLIDRGRRREIRRERTRC